MFSVLPYDSHLEARWDRFVMSESVNGTFLQTRRFLNYHPQGRFKDASFMLESSGTIVAAFPGILTDAGQWISHQGSTFGGPVISRNFYTAERVMHIMECAENYLKGFCRSVKMRPTSSLFSQEPTDLLEYVLEHRGYTRNSELSAVCTLEAGKDPLENCEKTCRSVFRKSQNFNLEYREMTDAEMPEFYRHLNNLESKFGTKPVHTLEELLDLRHNRIADEVKFRALWMRDKGHANREKFVAGMMLFDFKQTNVRHAQYIAPNEEIREFQPTTAMYINVMREAAQDGISKFSWGTSNGMAGGALNLPLFKFKESLGAKPSLNLIYSKEELLG
jgi:hypothetical protein